MMIRNVQKTDLTTLISMEKDVFGDRGLNAVTMRQQFDLFSEISFVAEKETEITGFVFCGVSIENRYGWILDLAVLKKFRRRGIATELLEKCIKTLGRFCKTKIILTVEPDNTTRVLYEGIGFKAVELDSHYFGENSPRLIMELNVEKNT